MNMLKVSNSEHDSDSRIVEIDNWRSWLTGKGKRSQLEVAGFKIKKIDIWQEIDCKA